jgi:putative ABC transport system substrate-binding protein
LGRRTIRTGDDDKTGWSAGSAAAPGRPDVKSTIVRLATVTAILAVVGLVDGQAQQRPATPRIGYVSGASGRSNSNFHALRHGLQELRYVEGQSVIIDARFAEGRPERLPEFVAELISLKVDVLVVVSTSAALAAKRATTTVPIVFVSVSDPVAAGVVRSLARPGANITGVAGWIGGAGFAGKWIELLKEVVPHITQVAVLSNSASPNTARQLREIQAAARTLNVKVDLLDAGSATNLEKAFAAISATDAQGIILTSDPFFAVNRTSIVEFAASKRLPAVYYFSQFADAGGLITYGASLEDSHRRAATYVDKILKGAKPADLPVEQPTKFELVINMKTAKALGLTIPQVLLLRADRIIE